MNTNVILGCDVAGIIALFYNEGYIAYDKNILSDFANKYELECNLIYSDDSKFAESLVRDVLEKYSLSKKYSVRKKIAHIGYEYTNYKISSIADEDFKKKYSSIIYGKGKPEQSYLLDSKGMINYIVLRDNKTNTDIKSSFRLLLSLISDNEKSRIINKKAQKIDIANNILYLEDKTEIKYKNMISTIPLKTFSDMSGFFVKSDFETIEKNFYICGISNKNDEQLSRKYNYIYSICSSYSKKTYNEGYIVYEITKKPVTKFIDGNEIIEKVSLHSQIKNNVAISSHKNIQFVGRRAQWDHNIRLQNLIKRFKYQVL